MSRRLNLRASRQQICSFLWEWKVLTTAGLSRKFYPKRSAITAYKNLRRLESQGFIQCVCDTSGLNYYWTLGKRGFQLVKEDLVHLKDEGYRSEYIRHDWLVTAFHLGDWLCEIPQKVELFSEQKLRRLDFIAYPEWIPKASEHRCDGYTTARGSKRNYTVAFEVELTAKKDMEYVGIANFYRMYTAIDEILWLVPNLRLAQSLKGYMEGGGMENSKPHSFVLLPEFLENGWGAIFKLGARSGMSIRNVMETEKETSWKHVSSPFLLDTRKARTILAPCSQ